MESQIADNSRSSSESNQPRKRTSSSKAGTVKQIFSLLIEKKAWWLIPMVSVFLLLGLLIVLTQGSALSPFIYALF